MAEVMENTLRILLFLFNETCTDTHSHDSCGKDSSKKHWWSLDGKKVQNWECLFVHGRRTLFLSVSVDDIKMAGKKQNLAPMWKKLMKNVDIEKPTSFLDHVYLGCAQRECKTKRENYWAKQQDVWIPYFCWSNREITSMGPHDMEGHARKCVERYCELANKKTEQQNEVSHLCLDGHQIKEEELENKGELSEVCSHIVLKCLYLARIGRPDILWSVNKLARSVTKMDSSMWQTIGTISFLHSFHEWLPPMLSCR